MIALYKNILYKLELVVLDNNGKFTPGLSITYEIRKCSDDSLFASGTMSETSSVYYVNVIFTEVAEYRIKYVTPTGYENGFTDILVEDYDNYKANISALALDATVAKEAQATINKDVVIAEINANEVKIDAIKVEEDLIKTETDKIQSDIINNKDAYKADVSNLALDSTVAKETTLNTKSSQTSVDAIKIDTESIITTLSTLVADVWSYTTRTLTSFGTLVADITTAVWGAVTRTLTACVKGSEIDAIKERTDKIPDDPTSETNATTNKDEIIDAINNIVIDLTNIEILIKRVLGLVQSNFRIVSTTYNTSGLLTASTVRIYDTKDDCINNVNPIGEYTLTASYDSNNNCTAYRMVKES